MPLFAVFLVAVEFVRRLGSFHYVQFVFHAVAHMQFAEVLGTCVGLSPTTPKKGSSVGPGCTNQRGHLHVPVEVAERGLREAGCVNIPQDIWDAIATPLALSVVCDVEVPRKELRPEELAMIRALVQQNHLAVLRRGMCGFGRAPNVPIFVIPKIESKCSFVVNCTLGNKAHKGPMPRMVLPNLHTLRHKLPTWAVMPRGRCPHGYMIKLDLTNCYFCLKLPRSAWGTFRV